MDERTRIVHATYEVWYFWCNFRPHEFELTPECLVFDILNIGLYHGWLIDPQDLQMVKSVGNLSYNQLVEKIIRSKDGDMEEEAIEEGNLHQKLT